MLESLFKNGGHDESMRLVVDSFKGEMSYITTCQNCKSESANSTVFSELCISLSSTENKTLLQNALMDMQRGELLTNENKYFCQKCQEKQDAVRRVRISTLPMV